MALLESCTSLSKTFGPRVLFENISLGISEGERLGLIGPNGSGKSTLLKILAGKMEADSGSISMRRNTRVGYVPQQVSFPPQLTAAEVIAAAIAGERLDDLERAARINQTLGRAGFTDGAAPAETLSGGWKRRLAIARELALDPDLLFLDEPTNHLDLEGILWLERLLASASFASVVVSHDRYFLDNVVNDMAEINRVYPEGLFRVDGGYSQFLEKKEEFLLAQSSRQESLANKVRREVEWLRRGPKARTGKSRARIDEAGRLMRELSGLEARAPRGAAQIDFTATDRRTKRLVSVEAISKDLGGRTLFRDLNLTLTPGTRLGLLGLNGTGKTTLLRILNGELEPDSGRIERAAAPAHRLLRPGARAARPERHPAPGPWRARRYRDLPRPAYPCRRVGQALPVRFRPARTSRLQPLGRRAGTRSDCPPDAPAGRPAAARRAHQRSRHPHPRGA